MFSPPLSRERMSVVADTDERPDDRRRLVERAAAAEVNGRQVNEAIERGTRTATAAVFVCECGHVGCNSTIELTIAAYESVRSGFERFLVVPGHELEDIEDIVERHETYLVVAKRDGQAVTIAAVTDDRAGNGDENARG
ncbi:MAG: hypothetical protein QOH18_127 [Solirubrobacterales bacterium]|jgi:hypothetical protein|nr:hypothetical protein [Solirubrobacterales bacterium]